jgi:hypothetical protein
MKPAFLICVGCVLILVGGILTACMALPGAAELPQAALQVAVQPQAPKAASAATSALPAPTKAAVSAAAPVAALPAVVTGTVVTADGPVSGAIVQVRGMADQVLSGVDGAFTVNGLSGTQPMTVTAWSAGNYVGYTTLAPGSPALQSGNPISITLKPLPEKDNNSYPWFSYNGVQGSASCGLCHREYKEWQADAHSQSAKNPRFISMYTGSDVQGRENQPVRWGNDGKALPPDPSLPYYGPGFQLDMPGRAGNCATCHTPVASKVSNATNCGWSGCHTDLTIERAGSVIGPATSPLVSSGDGAEGITCEFCHKIGDVLINPNTKMPLPDMPGILSYRLYRPPDGQQVFFGTLVDVPRRVSYSPLESQSQFCAACHYGVFGGVVGSGQVTGGTVIYNSYGEWLDSPYSDPKTGLSCQQCHMAKSSANYFVFPEEGGLARDYATLHNHTMPGASDEQLLKNAVSLKSAVQRQGAKLRVEVNVTNDRTGHDVPSDAPIRSMMLVVEATDATGKPLTLTDGPINPAWAGNYAKQPGKTFAKVLKDEWTGEAPTGAYWRPVSIVEDTRLKAMATDTTKYTFDLPAAQSAQVQVRLIYRRAFEALAKEKGWTDPDILMAENVIPVTK